MVMDIGVFKILTDPVSPRVRHRASYRSVDYGFGRWTGRCNWEAASIQRFACPLRNSAPPSWHVATIFCSLGTADLADQPRERPLPCCLVNHGYGWSLRRRPYHSFG